MSQPTSESSGEYHNVLDDFTPEQRAKAVQIKHGLNSAVVIGDLFDSKERALAEFSHYYGWSAMKEAEAGEMSARTFVALLAAAEDIERQQRLIRLTDANLVLSAMVDKKANKALNELIKQLGG